MRHGNIVYIVDPDEAIGEALSTLLGTYNVEVQVFPDAESFLQARSSWEMESGCVFIEADLPGLNGLTLLRRLRGQGFSGPVVVLANPQDHDIERQALRFGATNVMDKSLINDFLVSG